jgi:hypothetical protein
MTTEPANHDSTVTTGFLPPWTAQANVLSEEKALGVRPSSDDSHKPRHNPPL